MPHKNKVGEVSLNNFGSQMIICEYRNYQDIDVYFPKYNYTVRNKTYCEFKRKTIKCPYEKRTYQHGYIGEGKYDYSNNKDIYEDWRGVLMRVYDNSKDLPTYKECELDEVWHNFQRFAEWREENYYTISGKRTYLDKDILYKGNKLYSPQTCIYVPKRINNLFTTRKNQRGDYPIGVHYNKKANKFISQCHNGDTMIYLGLFDNPTDAFYEYKKYKEKVIKEVADEYKHYIPSELYQALYRYEININD